MASLSPPKRILVVDDNRDAADLTAQILSMHGHVAAVAYDGSGSIKTAMEFVPDVVLVDLGMPIMDGFEVAAALRKVPALERSVLIAYSAWSDAATRARAFASGFDTHIAKPARLDEILQTVATIGQGAAAKGMQDERSRQSA
jgi:CheY-like chemotaxis protein